MPTAPAPLERKRALRSTDPAAAPPLFGRAPKGGVTPFSASLSYELPYASRRVPILADQAIATSHPLAAQAGLLALARGGTATDAAIAAAAVLTVVEPTMTGVGGDAFALIADEGRLVGLNASGRAPRAWSLERFRGKRTMPELGWDAVTVPGAVSAWAAMSARFGRLPFADLLAPAIRYAREGFPVMPRTAELWSEAPQRYCGFAEFCRVFLPSGSAPRAGSWMRLPDLADTLEAIAQTRGASFYTGELAQKIARAASTEGGAMSEDDLARHEPEWVEPVAVPFRDAEVHELPPNGQGMAALIALGILDELPLEKQGPDHPDTLHWQIEAMKIAFAECQRHLGDRGAMKAHPQAWLSKQRLAAYAKRIRLDRAARPRPLPPPDHGTGYVTVADADGQMVSFIQSNYLGFGSGVVVPGTGISLHNRGRGFSLEPGHPNVVAGGARPFHTIIPGFLSRGGVPSMSFGVMGAHMQPQGHVQLVVRTVAYAQNPQAACDAPRWYVSPESKLALEPAFPKSVHRELERRGHRLMGPQSSTIFGGAQAIARLERGYVAASDPRKDGQAVGL